MTPKNQLIRKLAWQVQTKKEKDQRPMGRQSKYLDLLNTRGTGSTVISRWSQDWFFQAALEAPSLRSQFNLWAKAQEQSSERSAHDTDGDGLFSGNSPVMTFLQGRGAEAKPIARLSFCLQGQEDLSSTPRITSGLVTKHNVL